MSPPAIYALFWACRPTSGYLLAALGAKRKSQSLMLIVMSHVARAKVARGAVEDASPPPQRNPREQEHSSVHALLCDTCDDGRHRGMTDAAQSIERARSTRNLLSKRGQTSSNLACVMTQKGTRFLGQRDDYHTCRSLTDMLMQDAHFSLALGSGVSAFSSRVSLALSASARQISRRNNTRYTATLRRTTAPTTPHTRAIAHVGSHTRSGTRVRVSHPLLVRLHEV